MGQIQTLIDEGALVLYHNYRANHALDLSGQDNAGVLTDTAWQGGGLRFNASTSKVTVADAAELQLTEGTLVVLGDFLSQTVNERLISKRSAIGTNYDLFLNATPGLSLHDGTNTRTINTNIVGSRLVAINMADGAIGEAFVDGLSIGNLNAASDLSADNAPLIIGAFYGAGANLHSSLHAALIINRKLSATEHAALYAELTSLAWPHKVTSRAAGSVGVELVSDGDMETGGTAAWTAGNAAALSKQSGGALSGSQVLRVAHNGTTDPYAYQNILTVGKAYRVTGWARGDGTAYPQINCSVTLWKGSTSTAWQFFDVVFADAVSPWIIFFARIAAAGYTEFDNITVRKIESEEVQFKTDFAAHASDVNITAGYLENTPFEIMSVGSAFKVSAYVLGENVFKQIDTVVAGVYSLDGKLFHVDPTLAAYGTWDFWLWKADAGLVIISFVAQALTDITAGDYVLSVDASEVVTLGISGGATLITGAMEHDAWVHIKITRRQSDGLFELFIDDISAGTGTDTSLKTSVGMVFGQDVGGSLALSDLHGDHALIKKLGVG